MSEETTAPLVTPEQAKMLGDVGLTVVPHPYGSKFGLMLATKDKMIEEVFVQWLAGMKTVRVGANFDTGETIPGEISKFPIIEEVMRVAGVTSVVLVPYLAEIGRAEAFTWEEIIPPLTDAWKTYQLRREFDSHE